MTAAVQLCESCAALPVHGGKLPELLHGVEGAAMRAAVETTRGNNVRGAALLGISRRHFQERLRKHCLAEFARSLRSAA